MEQRLHASNVWVHRLWQGLRQIWSLFQGALCLMGDKDEQTVNYDMMWQMPWVENSQEVLHLDVWERGEAKASWKKWCSSDLEGWLDKGEEGQQCSRMTNLCRPGGARKSFSVKPEGVIKDNRDEAEEGLRSTIHRALRPWDGFWTLSQE